MPLLKIKIISPHQYRYGNKEQWYFAGDYQHLDTVNDLEEIKAILSPNYAYKEYIHIDRETIPKEFLETYDDLKESNIGGIPIADGDLSKPEPLDIAPQKPKDEFDEDPEPLGEADPNPFAEKIEQAKLKNQQQLIENPEPEPEQVSSIGTAPEPPLDLPNAAEQVEPIITQQQEVAPPIQEITETPVEEPIVEDDQLEEILDSISELEEVEELEQVADGNEQSELLEIDSEAELSPRELRANYLDEQHWQTVKSEAQQYGIEYTNKDEVIEKILAKEFD